MLWRKEMIEAIEPNAIWSQAEIYLTDDNIKPDWIAIPAKNTEYYVKRGKEDVLIIIGESWTYGESLPEVATALQKYNLTNQLRYTFGSIMANRLDMDLYQYAVPGNCNFYMFKELERILPHVSTLGYRNIYVCVQMTEPSREMAISYQGLKGHPLDDLYQFDVKMKFEDWLVEYDKIFFRQYDEILKPYNNVKAVLWKNFCSINTDLRFNTFQVVEDSWIRISNRHLGGNIRMPKFYSVGWYDHMQTDRPNLIYDTRWSLEQLDIIEESNKFLTGGKLHWPHPSPTAHTLWAEHLLKETGWLRER